MNASPHWARVVRLGGELMWVALGQGIAALGALVGVRLLTEALPPHTYGELALGMSVVAIVQMALLQPLYEGSLRFFRVAADEGEPRLLVTAMLRSAAKTIAVQVLAGLAALTLLAATATDVLGLTAGALALSIISTGSLTISGLQNAARHRSVVAWHDGMAQWLRFAAALALISQWGPRSSVAMAGYAAASAVVLASQVWFLTRHPEFRPTMAARWRPRVRRWEAEVRRYAWPFVTWGLAISAQIASARWALQRFSSTESVGLYAALYQTGYYPVVLMIGVLSQFLTPLIFRWAGVGPGADRQTAHRLGRLMVGGAMVLTLLATATAAVGHDALFAALVGPDYRAVSWLLPMMVLGSGLFGSGHVASFQAMVDANTRTLMVPRVGSALIGTALNVVGARAAGVEGVVWASVAYGAISFLWISITVVRTSPAATEVAGKP